MEAVNCTDLELSTYLQGLEAGRLDPDVVMCMEPREWEGTVK